MFLVWEDEYTPDRRRVAYGAGQRVLSSLLEYSALPSQDFLGRLARDGHTSLAWLKTCFLGAVVSASNPFIPGMHLSVSLAGAAEDAPEGERRNLIPVQQSVDDLLLEVLERLPQTVLGFNEHMRGCSAVFEPEGSKEHRKNRRGPLRMALKERQQMETFCTVPLVMDFIYRRFTRGLPGLWDTGRILNNLNELANLAGGEGDERDDNLILGDSDKFRERCEERNLTWRDLRHYHRQYIKELLGKDELLPSLFDLVAFLQGADPAFPGLTLLPGAQFIIAGLVAKPNSYYRVPAMRMVFDFLVYLAMLAVFSALVLFHADGALTVGEIFFAWYILVSKHRRERGRTRLEHSSQRPPTSYSLEVAVRTGSPSKR